MTWSSRRCGATRRRPTLPTTPSIQGGLRKLHIGHSGALVASSGGILASSGAGGRGLQGLHGGPLVGLEDLGAGGHDRGPSVVTLQRGDCWDSSNPDFGRQRLGVLQHQPVSRLVPRFPAGRRLAGQAVARLAGEARVDADHRHGKPPASSPPPGAQSRVRPDAAARPKVLTNPPKMPKVPSKKG